MTNIPYYQPPIQPQQTTPNIKIKFPICACFFVAYLLTFIIRLVVMVIRNVALMNFTGTVVSFITNIAFPLLTVAVLFIIIIPLFMKKRNALLALGCIALLVLHFYDVYTAIIAFLNLIKIVPFAELPTELKFNYICNISMTLLIFAALVIVAILAIESTKLINITFDSGLKNAAVIITAVLLVLALILNSVYLIIYFYSLAQDIAANNVVYLEVIYNAILGETDSSVSGYKLITTAFNTIMLPISYVCLLLLTPSLILLARWLANPNAKSDLQINTANTQQGLNIV